MEARIHVGGAGLDVSQLPGEDLSTAVLPEVAGWIAIYEELASVLRSVISRANDSHNVEELQRNLAWIEDRLAAWRDRHAELAGVVVDRKNLALVYAGKTLRLTRREADLLDFLMRHPRRQFTSKQLPTLAWQNSRLSDAQVRTYIMRLRTRLREIGLEDVITVARNRGYAMTGAIGHERTEAGIENEKAGGRQGHHVEAPHPAVEAAHAFVSRTPDGQTSHRAAARAHPAAASRH